LNIYEKEYNRFISDKGFTRKVINKSIEEHPEIFPQGIIEHDYKLNGKTRISKKMGYEMVKIKICEEQYQIQPSFVLPYMRGSTDEASKAIFY